MILSGINKGLDDFNRLKLLINDKDVINLINDSTKYKNKPYRNISNNVVECYIKLTRYKEYFTEFIIKNINTYISIEVQIKNYCYDGNYGTTLILRNIL